MEKCRCFKATENRTPVTPRKQVEPKTQTNPTEESKTAWRNGGWISNKHQPHNLPSRRFRPSPTARSRFRSVKVFPGGPLIGGGSPLPAPEELFRTPAPTREKVGDAVTGDASAVAGTSPQFPPSMVGRGRPLVGLAGIQDNPMLPPQHAGRITPGGVYDQTSSWYAPLLRMLLTTCSAFFSSTPRSAAIICPSTSFTSLAM